MESHYLPGLVLDMVSFDFQEDFMIWHSRILKKLILHRYLVFGSNRLFFYRSREHSAHDPVLEKDEDDKDGYHADQDACCDQTIIH